MMSSVCANFYISSTSSQGTLDNEIGRYSVGYMYSLI